MQIVTVSKFVVVFCYVIANNDLSVLVGLLRIHMSLAEAEDKLFHLRETLLDSLECENTNCTKVFIESTGPSGLRHPPK